MSIFTSVDPSTGRTIATYETLRADEIDARLGRAVEAYGRWRSVPVAARADVLTGVADLLDARRDVYARLITDEMGKLLVDARAEVAKCATGCRYYAEHAARMLAPEPVATEATRSYVTFDPLGPVLAVMPWNFPFWQVFRFAAPTIVAGNVALLKHAANVSGAALAIESVWRDAGAPDGVFQTLLVPSGDVAALIADDRVRAVTLTGSEHAGTSVAENAGRVCKKCVLELGGSDPFIVLADADPVRAAHAAVKARVVNSGQSCIAAKRFIAVGAVADPFTRAFADAMRALRVGDPRDAATDVGPLARGDLRDELVRQIDGSLAAGARRLIAPATVPSAGFFFPPTVLADVHPGMPAFDEEVFGPVAAVVTADSDADAIALANRSRYGLGGSIWTRDAAHAEALAHELDCGMVFVNDLVRSDPRLPFGGVKRSGYGRELSHYGIHEFVNVRTVVIGGEGRTAGTPAGIE
ncbi:MAG: NAD-dependent succinate-semialdehyde dehydrogenase [Deltaproteobacteria bacterium]|nr:MAG: NAD-dependent succinate-semialdehyde dehydrogenase [Deltaproteobacteria bacterium]